MDTSKAEAELLELLRLQDAKNFTLAVTVADGQWTVATGDLDSGVHAVGHGSTFEAAWFDQTGKNLR